MRKRYVVAVAGATGAVGSEMLRTLEKRNFPVSEIRFLASSRSHGKKIKFKGKLYRVEEMRPDSFRGVDIALFSAGASRSKEFAPSAVKSGAVVIDNSSAFRMDKGVPLVVPEVNPHAIFKHKGIIANPNCSTIQMVVVLKPLHDLYKIKRIVVSTYQSTSGAGAKAMYQLYHESAKILKQFKMDKERFIPKPKLSQINPVLPKQIGFNLIPQIDVFLDNGYTKEEMKMVYETHKIMEDSSIAVSPTCVRAPVFIAHSESVNIETEKKIALDEVFKALRKAPGVKVLDNTKRSDYPMPIDVAGCDDVYVGRIRRDESVENGLNMWIVGDNLKKGAALNAVQIAEKLIRN